MRQTLLILIFILTSSIEAKTFSGLDAIYGKDDRDLINKKSDPKILELSRSVALIVSNDLLDKGLLRTDVSAKTAEAMLLMCSDEKFIKSPALSGCTGFLIGSDLMATAGHCFRFEEDCANNKIIFDVDSSKQSKVGYTVANANVYSCKKILVQEEGFKDYAIIQLNRAPKNRPLLKMNLTSKIHDDAKIFMIGHPMGLPLTHSKPALITNNESQFVFKSALDSFSGNSGSPVFNAKTFLVEGILVNGREDLVQDLEKQCYRNKNYEEASGGEGIFRVSELPRL